ncbi:FHA domain-containing protein [Anaerolineales bacterium HSG6]|nr:FHA domain-containing protein [Anaerolineales bacterium HSG6]
MSQSNQYQDGGYQDNIVVRHPSGKSEKFPGPAYEEEVLRLGRELDNDIILNDPRSSRYHAEIRRTNTGDLEIRDLGSANGVLIGKNKIDPQVWHPITAGQSIQVAETRMFWEAAVSSQPTVAMKPSKGGPPPPVAAASFAQPTATQKDDSNMPLMAGIAALVILLLLIGGAAFYFMFMNQQNVATGPQATPVATFTSTPAGEETSGREGTSLGEQAVTIPTDTPTPAGPQLAIPVVDLVNTRIEPILLGALPSADKGLLLVDVRVQNLGNIPFELSTDDFSVRTRDGKQSFVEAGGNTSPDGLKRLGVIDRFNELNLTPGGSVPETLVYELPADDYDLELFFEPAGVAPIILSLGEIEAGKELALALGNPLPEDTPTPEPVAVAEGETATPTTTPTDTPEPTPTATRPALIPAPNVVPKSSLVGTIAYPVHDGMTYNLYFGQVDGSGSQFFRGQASQPSFNADGSRIAFRSWANDSRGLITMDTSGANGKLVATFIEDQLPTWNADGSEVIFLTRRSGDRKSQLFKASADTEQGEAAMIGEGEYPSIGLNGQMAFRGWGNTAFGIRVGSANLEDLESSTNSDDDTAPALSPDGEQVVFMSRRDGQWDIYVVNVDGSGMARLTTDEADDGLPTWSPDGNALAFVSNRGGPWAIWVMTPSGDGKSQLFTMEGSPDGFVGSSSATDSSRGWAEERISWTK